jgi:hypothetical protein
MTTHHKRAGRTRVVAYTYISANAHVTRSLMFVVPAHPRGRVRAMSAHTGTVAWTCLFAMPLCCCLSLNFVRRPSGPSTTLYGTKDTVTISTNASPSSLGGRWHSTPPMKTVLMVRRTWTARSDSKNEGIPVDWLPFCASRESVVIIG